MRSNERHSKARELAGAPGAGAVRLRYRGAHTMLTWIGSTVGKIVSLLVVVLLGFLLVRWYIGKEARADAERAAFKITVKAKDDSLDVARAEKARLDSALANQVPIYIAGRDRILHDPAKPASPEVRACYEAADKVISACQKARAADSVVIAQQASLIGTLRNPPPPKGLARVQAFGEALYDFNQRVPVIRAGATAKILGPVHLSVAGEYAAPPAGQSTPVFRALVGARVNF